MNIIGGLITGEEQMITLDKKKINVDESFGYVFQTSRLLPWLSVKENVELVCDKELSDSKNSQINSLLESFGLKDFVNFIDNG